LRAGKRGCYEASLKLHTEQSTSYVFMEQSRLLSVNNWKRHDIYVHKYMNIYVTFMNEYI
jgi:hypothetical protein